MEPKVHNIRVLSAKQKALDKAIASMRNQRIREDFQAAISDARKRRGQ